MEVAELAVPIIIGSK